MLELIRLISRPFFKKKQNIGSFAWMENSSKYTFDALVKLIPAADIEHLRKIVKTVREDKKFYTYKQYSDLLISTSDRLLELMDIIKKISNI